VSHVSTALRRHPPAAPAQVATLPAIRRRQRGPAWVGRAGWLLIPAGALYAGFVLWPIGQTVWLSFTNWDGTTGSPTWKGLDNYRRLVGDTRFLHALENNFKWVAGSWLAQGLGLLIAALLSAQWIRARTFFRTVMFIPATMSLVVVGIVWDQIYDPNTGVLNTALTSVGLRQLNHGWLADQHTAMPAVIATANWTYYGFAMVIFLGGLQAIDNSLYEAAALDGCGALRQFRYVTLPGLSNQITLLLLVSFINTLRTFDLVYVMTSGGPGRSTEVAAYYIYSLAFVTNQVGYGAAVAVALTVLVLIVTVVFLRLREKNT
jgi:raffinose/stachyose/melibiose transport system permease protein